MQPAQLADQFVAGAEEQVIGIGEQDLDVEILGEVALGQSLDRGLRADGHEDGRLDVAVRGMEQAGAGAGVGTLGKDFEGNLAQVRL